MNLPELRDIDVKDKRILLRLDLDVRVDRDSDKVAEDYRLKAAIPTINYLLEHGCGRIVILGHRGRPEGKVVEELSLKPVAEYLEKLLANYLGKEKTEKMELYVMENLRFDERESSDSAQGKDKMMELAKEIAKEGDVYVNDAFGVCHREEVSVVALPLQFKYKNSVAAGLRLQEEVENLSKVLNPSAPFDSAQGKSSGLREPVVFILGGGKMDKVILIDKLLDLAETVLVGGVLPKEVKSYCRGKDGGMCVVAAHLYQNGEDISPDSTRNFVEVIERAGTIIWNGPMGDIDNNYWEATEEIAQAIANSNAFKIVGGGDTILALQRLGLLEKMDYVSTGGGAMLEFLAYGDLPGLAALRETAHD